MAKRALLVGINDVTNMRDILKTYLGFTNRDIRVLVDSRATKANIVYRLESMVKQAKAGDFLVFHFSGHGSQIRDRDGDELKGGIRSFKSPKRSTVHHILWAGCKDNQTSADAYINNSYNGAFTYFFCKHMRASGGSLSRNELLRRVRQSLQHNGYSQIPQLECEATVRSGRVLTERENAGKGKKMISS